MAQETCPHCGSEINRTDKVCPHCGKGLTGKALIAAQSDQLPATTVSSGAMLLLLAGVAGVGLGALFLSEATTGVGLICGGCFLAVWARILQAGLHHREAINAISATRTRQG